MAIRPFLPLAIVVLVCIGGITACKLGSSNEDGAPPKVLTSYSGSASVGDCISLTINHTDKTVTYQNLTYAAGPFTVGYTVNGDGTYAFSPPSDPAQNTLVYGYEIDGYALIVEASNTGLNRNQASVLTAVKTEPISLAQMLTASAQYNYIQFRPDGEPEIGSSVLDGSGSTTLEFFTPSDHNNNRSDGYRAPSIGPLSTFTQDPSGNFLWMLEPGETVRSYVFKTSGFFVTDLPTGSQICTAQWAPDATVAGTYTGVFYNRLTNTNGSASSSAPSITHNTVTVDATNHLTVKAAGGLANKWSASNALLTDLTTGGYVGGGKLSNACRGILTTTVTDVADGQPVKVFVSFINRAIVFTSIKVQPDTVHYEIFYGVALKTSNLVAAPAAPN